MATRTRKRPAPKPKAKAEESVSEESAPEPEAVEETTPRKSEKSRAAKPYDTSPGYSKEQQAQMDEYYGVAKAGTR